MCFGEELILEMLEEFRVGRGAFADVYEATWKDRRVAVKVVDKGRAVGEAAQTIKREIGLLRTAIPHHENIVRYLADYEDGRSWYLVLELLRGGNL